MSQNQTKYSNEEINNVYAFNLKNEEIHISEAESGRKGYYCLGCKREMQAVLSIISGRISYFRHDAKAVKGQGKCTYSDETYRHRIAKEILARLKRIKVPPVYKYPPNGNSGKVYQLADAKLIEAHSVGVERSFFEDDNGEIHCQKSEIPINEKHLLIRPDLTFFDTDDNPILFIEIVVTHKVTDEKVIKLKRLGVDTVQIRIPKDSPQEIEKSFLHTQNIKWIYNNEEQRTDYISIPEGSTEGVPSIDDEQRKLFAESTKCRSAQINNLIRTINRCLESKLYRGIEGGLESELSRVEGNAERVRSQLHELQGEINVEVEGRFRDRREQFRVRETESFVEEREFQRYFKDLEGRYFAKRRLLETQIRTAIAGIGGNAESFETRRSNLEREARKVDGDIRQGERRIEENIADRERLASELRISFEANKSFEEHETKRIQHSIDELPNKFEKLAVGVRNEFKYLEDTEKREIGDIEKFEIEFDKHVEEGRRDLEGRFKNIREGIVESIKVRDDRSNSEFAGKLKDLIKNGALLIHFEEAQTANRRYKYAWECFKSGAY